MPSANKVEKVAAIKERIEGSQALLLAEYRGLTVHDATELRRSLADQARFAVVKNTLMKLAAGQAGMDELGPLLEGPTAVAFVSGDVVTAAKRVVEAAKRFPSLVIKGGWMEGRLLSGEQARGLAELESREVMLSKMAGLLKGEMTRAASLFQTLQGRFLGLLEAYQAKLPPDETPEVQVQTPPEAQTPEGVAQMPEALEAEGSAEVAADTGPTDAETAPGDPTGTSEKADGEE